jgi:hypothetical protein
MTADGPELTTGGAPSGSPSEPVSTLRGASASVDPRRAAQVVVGIVMAALAAVGIVFIVVGINKNNQINELKEHGVPVAYVVSKCLGELGGSGSNAAGYSCQGSYEIGGHRYVEALPGSSSIYAPGTHVPAVSVPSDPTLLSTPAIVSSERASWNVFIVPIVLLGAFVLLLLVVLLRRRRTRPAADSL